MAGERPDWEWYRLASARVAAGRLQGAEDVIESALHAGHLWRVSLLGAPTLEPLRGRPRYEAAAAEARRRVQGLHLEPKVLVASPDRATAAPLLLVLHGARGNAADELVRWRPATEVGFIVAAAQSSQPATADGFCWDPPYERVRADLRVIVSRLPAHARVVTAGFSQGAWVGLNVALEGRLVVSGSVVMVAPFAPPKPELLPAWRRLKVSILLGDEDQYREPVRALAALLEQREHHVSLDFVPRLGHAYPRDFATRLPNLLRPWTRRRGGLPPSSRAGPPA